MALTIWCARVRAVPRSWLAWCSSTAHTPRSVPSEYRLLAKRARTNLLPLVVNGVAQALYVEGYHRSDGGDQAAVNDDITTDDWPVYPLWGDPDDAGTDLPNPRDAIGTMLTKADPARRAAPRTAQDQS